MNRKEQLIIQIIESELESIKKTGRQQEDMLKDLNTNGNGDIHPDSVESIKMGLSYTHGYSIGHSCLSDKVLELLRMTEDEIQESINESNRISKENKIYTDKILSKIKKKIPTPPESRTLKEGEMPRKPKSNKNQ